MTSASLATPTFSMCATTARKSCTSSTGEVDLGTVHGCVDWARRFDHMQQHTGQHLLSAMFQERFGRPTVSFHLGSERQHH